MAELLENVGASARIKRFFRELKGLKLSELIVEHIEASNRVNIDVKHGLKRFQTIRAFCHGGIMNRVSLVLFVLEGQNVSITLEHIINVLLKQAHKSKFKLLVSADSLSIVLDGAVKLSLFDVHGLHAVAALLLAKLIVHHLLEAHAFVV